MPLSRARRWALLVVVGAGVLLITLDNSILYTALPRLTHDIRASNVQSLWIVSAYPVVMAGLLLGAGTLGDRIGHRRMFLIGLALFGLASLGAAYSPTPEALIAARALLAVGGAAMMPATLALLRLTFTDVRERNVAMATWGCIAVVGGALGPIAAGLLLEHFWWGSIFLINVPIVIAAFVAGALLAPPDEPDPTRRWDAYSSLQAMVALVAAVLLIKEVGHRPPSWPVIVISALVAAVVGAAFVRRQRRLADPLLDLAIFRIPAFSCGVAGAALSLVAIGGVQLVTAQRYQLVEGWTPLQAGALVTAVAVGSLLTSLPAGAVLHRSGLQPLISGGLAVGAVGMGVATVGVHLDSLATLITGLVVTGAGLGVVMGVASVAIVGSAPPERAGMASSIEEASYEFGNLLAVAVVGSLLSGVFAAVVDLPRGAPAQAGHSLTDAVESSTDPAVLAAAFDAYGSAHLAAMILMTGVLVVGAVVTHRSLRDYGPGGLEIGSH